MKRQNLACLLALLAFTGDVAAQDQPGPRDLEAASYKVDFLTLPQGEVIEVGGLDFLQDGRLVVSTRRGRVWIVDHAQDPDPRRAHFQLFAEGLDEGLGLKVVGDQIYVLQRGELSRLVDKDGDGRSDRVETLCAEWGMTGNYHEFAYGLPRDRKGNWYISLNLGFWNPKWWLGRSRAWGRGWVMRVGPDGHAHLFATGFRSPNGLALNQQDELFVTDNQGDWMPVCPLYHVQEGGFYGHPAGLRWTEAFGEGRRIPDLVQLPKWKREPAAVWFPYALSRSAAGLAWDHTEGRFGPFTGQLFVAELTNGLIVRTMLEKVQGEYQGACIPFRHGVGCANRVAFAPDGTLFVGLTERGWGGTGRPFGISRVRYTGKKPFELLSIKLREQGFLLRFTEPLEALPTPGQISLVQYDYNWWWKYGSPRTHLQPLATGPLSLVEGGRGLLVSVPGLQAGYVIEGILKGLRSKQGRSLVHGEFAYTLNRLRRGAPAGDDIARRVLPPPTLEEERQGWLNISDGYTLAGWRGQGWQAANISLPAKDARRFALKAGISAYVNANPGSPNTTDLSTRLEHGDCKAKVEFCLPAGGRGELLFAGRYALLLADCFGERDPERFVLGAVPQGRESGGQLLAPQNVCERPGQWQTLELSYRGPRFDAAGRKVRPARFLNVRINNKVLWKEVAVSGMAGDIPFKQEGERGPFVLRGRLGQCAFRMVRIQPADWEMPLPRGSRILFEGKSLQGWQPMGWARFELNHGLLQASGGTGYLFSKQLRLPDHWKSLAIHLKARLSTGGRAALLLGAELGKGKPGGYRILLDADSPGKEHTGSLMGLAPVLSHYLLGDTWFLLQVRVQRTSSGLRFQIFANGVRINTGLGKKPLGPAPRLALEHRGGNTRLDVALLAYKAEN